MGLKVREFMFGLPGPRIFSFKWGETQYGMTAVPLGGYVRFAGVESELQTEEDEEDRNTPPERKYDTQPRWKKAIIMLSGPAMNMVLAVILLALILMIQGVPQASTTIGDIIKGGPAQKAGLMKGDKILVFDGKKVDKWESVVTAVKAKPHQQVTIVVKRNGKTVLLKPTLGSNQGKGFLGVASKIVYKRLPPHTALYHGVVETGVIIKEMVSTLYNVIAHKPATLAKDSAGPVGITAVSVQVIKRGIWDYFWLLSLISVNIGIINLLPIPPLDGGRLAILGIESIRRKPISQKIVFGINAVGMALLLMLMVYFVFADIGKILQGTLIPGGG